MSYSSLPTRARWGSAKDVLPTPLRSLHTVKIYLPSRTELVPIPKVMSSRLRLPSTSSVVQSPSAPAPRVVHHDSVEIPKEFDCGVCRPATDGSLVYLLARTKERFIAAPGAYTFWVFVYDWKIGRGLRMRLPEVFQKTFAFSLYRLTPRAFRMVVGGKLWDQDTRLSFKTGGI